MEEEFIDYVLGLKKSIDIPPVLYSDPIHQNKELECKSFDYGPLYEEDSSSNPVLKDMYIGKKNLATFDRYNGKYPLGEIRFGMLSNHPNILSFEEFRITDNHMFLCYPHVKYSLDKVLGKNVFSFKQKLIHVINLGKAINYIHKAGYVHCNIQPSSILFRNNMQIVLGGFDLITMEESNISESCQLLPYRAPEFLGKKEKFESDMSRVQIYYIGKHGELIPKENVEKNPELLGDGPKKFIVKLKKKDFVGQAANDLKKLSVNDFVFTPADFVLSPDFYKKIEDIHKNFRSFIKGEYWSYAIICLEIFFDTKEFSMSKKLLNNAYIKKNFLRTGNILETFINIFTSEPMNYGEKKYMDVLYKCFYPALFYSDNTPLYSDKSGREDVFEEELIYSEDVPSKYGDTAGVFIDPLTKKTVFPHTKTKLLYEPKEENRYYKTKESIISDIAPKTRKRKKASRTYYEEVEQDAKDLSVEDLIKKEEEEQMQAEKDFRMQMFTPTKDRKPVTYSNEFNYKDKVEYGGVAFEKYKMRKQEKEAYEETEQGKQEKEQRELHETQEQREQREMVEQMEQEQYEAGEKAKQNILNFVKENPYLSQKKYTWKPPLKRIKRKKMDETQIEKLKDEEFISDDIPSDRIICKKCKRTEEEVAKIMKDIPPDAYFNPDDSMYIGNPYSYSTKDGEDMELYVLDNGRIVKKDDIENKCKKCKIPYTISSQDEILKKLADTNSSQNMDVISPSLLASKLIQKDYNPPISQYDNSMQYNYYHTPITEYDEGIVEPFNIKDLSDEQKLWITMEKLSDSFLKINPMERGSMDDFLKDVEEYISSKDNKYISSSDIRYHPPVISQGEVMFKGDENTFNILTEMVRELRDVYQHFDIFLHPSVLILSIDFYIQRCHPTAGYCDNYDIIGHHVFLRAILWVMAHLLSSRCCDDQLTIKKLSKLKNDEYVAPEMIYEMIKKIIDYENCTFLFESIYYYIHTSSLFPGIIDIMVNNPQTYINWGNPRIAYQNIIANLQDESNTFIPKYFGNY